MVRRRRINDYSVGIVNEETIHKDSGLVTITNRHIGSDVYEIKVVSETGEGIETSDKMTRERAWAEFDEKCAHYKNGINPLSEEKPISFEDLEEVLPGSLLGSLDY